MVISMISVTTAPTEAVEDAPVRAGQSVMLAAQLVTVKICVARTVIVVTGAVVVALLRVTEVALAPRFTPTDDVVAALIVAVVTGMIDEEFKNFEVEIDVDNEVLARRARKG